MTQRAYLFAVGIVVCQIVAEVEMGVDITGMASDMDSRMAFLEQSLDTLQSELNSSNSQMDAVLAKLATTEYELNSIKQELRFNVNKLEKNVSKLQTTVSEMGGNATKTAEDIKSLESLLDDTNVEVNTVISNLTAFKSEMQLKFSDLTTDMAGNSSHIGHTGTYVAFQASPSVEKPGWTILKFDDVSYNQGGGYNPNTGLFTAPVSGTYLFWASILIRGSSGNVYINKGNERLAAGYGALDNGIPYSTAAAMAVVHMNAGETMHFYFDVTGDFVHSARESFIGGALLRAHRR